MSILSTISRGKRPRHIFALLYGTDGVGKCLGKNTPVLMADGSLRAVQFVKNGDLVMGPDSQPRLVSNVMRGFGHLFRVIPTKGESWVCNENHVLTVCNIANQRFTTVDVPITEYLALSHCQKRHRMLIRCAIDFVEQRTELDPYFVGLWIAEGTRTSASIQLTNPDQEIIDYVRNLAEQNGLLFRLTRDPRNNKCPRLSVVNYAKGPS
jgi:replicative DNA helicase